MLLAGVAAPFISAARFSESIRDALQLSLGRPVSFDAAHFTLFSGPGFSLENVTIAEDPRYGLEPFAFVPVLEARVRLDKLLTGRIQFTSLRLVNPSLNLVKRSDGTWNVVALLDRLAAPRRVPLSLFPSFEVAEGRVDFKFGTRKTVLYISESDVSVYPQRSGKIYLRFSGSPARTDRAGMGFGHFRGGVTWFTNAGSGPGRLQAEVTLDPSNLSELTTLVEGHDVGVHGTVSSQLYLEGAIDNLQASGQLQLNEVHRWDLLPARGEAWSVHYGGKLDLLSHSLDVRTLPPPAGQAPPVNLHLRVADFLAHPEASVIAELKGAPLPDLLRLASRMGVSLPPEADLRGAVSGAVSFSNQGGWSGGLEIVDAQAALAGAPALAAGTVSAVISNDHVHFEPVELPAGAGVMRLSGDYYFANQQADASLSAAAVPVAQLAPVTDFWLGGLGSLAAIKEGSVTGQFSYARHPEPAWNPRQPAAGASWSGDLTLSEAVVRVPGVPLPLEDARAHIRFRDAAFEWDHLTATVAGQSLRASYRFNPLARHTERAHVEFTGADLSQVDQALTAADEPAGFWAHFRFGRRALPAWLAHRNLEGDLIVDSLSAQGQALGAFRSHVLWQAGTLEFSRTSLHLAQGDVTGSGSLDLTASQPAWQFAAEASGFPWSGGQLSAQGHFATTGSGSALLRNLTATGTFTGADIALSSLDSFASVSGLFQFSFADGWPDLRLSQVQAVGEGVQWTGEGLSQPDGKLLVNLAHEGQALHLVSSLDGERAPEPVSAIPGGLPAFK